MEANRNEKAVCFICDWWWLFVLILFVIIALVLTRDLWLPLLGIAAI